jgi:DNA-binding winged helix-turn-helix (wHTH) protein
MHQSNTYAFGPFRLYTGTQLLCNEESCVNLAPKVYRLLLYFLLHSGRLISHEELFESVWDGRVVEDTALRLAVNSLRKILRDQSKSPRYISTVCKRGYRFLALVTVMEGYRIAEAAEPKFLHYRQQAQTPHVKLEYIQELAELQEIFQKASNGERRLVFLRGEKNIGKTALLDRFLAKVQHPELAVLRARCVKMRGVAEPFLPLLEALQRRCREPDAKLLIERLNHFAPTWLYQLLNVLEPDEIAMLYPKVSHINTGRMLREGADFFEHASTTSTFVLILDNSHWSDEFTLDLLYFLMFRCSPAKLLIIISYRSCDNGPGVQRIEEMRTELSACGLCRELSIQKCRN